MNHRGKTFRVLTAAAIGITALSLAGCSTPDPDPEKVSWKEVADEPIIAIDSSTGVYVIVSRHSASVNTDVDYRFATRMETGAIREDQIGSYMRRVVGEIEDSYPYVDGTFVVDIYEDVTAESAHFTVFRCEADKYETIPFWGTTYYPCVTEDGREVGYRVDLHVPKETIIHELSE